MSAPDPEFWKGVASWLWAALLIPVGVIWKKVDGSVQKEEFESRSRQFREDIRQLYQNAEEDRTVVREGFTKIIQEMHAAENRLRDKIEAK